MAKETEHRSRNAIRVVFDAKSLARIQELSAGSPAVASLLRPSPDGSERPWTLAEVRALHRALQQKQQQDAEGRPSEGGGGGGSSRDDFGLHRLLENATVLFPELPETPRNPELEARIARLKKEQQEREYDLMVRNVDLQRASKLKSDMSFSSDVKAMRAQMVAVVNFIVTVGGTFAFAYKLVEYSLSEPSLPAQVLFGIIMSSVVALAEIYFLAKQLDFEERQSH